MVADVRRVCRLVSAHSALFRVSRPASNHHATTTRSPPASRSLSRSIQNPAQRSGPMPVHSQPAHNNSRQRRWPFIITLIPFNHIRPAHVPPMGCTIYSTMMQAHRKVTTAVHPHRILVPSENENLWTRKLNVPDTPTAAESVAGTAGDTD